MNTTAPHEWVDGCLEAHAALIADLSGLTDAAARRPSRLPGWSVGHVLTHLARNADSVVRRLDGVIRGEVLDQYVGGLAGRSADIEAGANRTAADLVADVTETAAAVDAAITTLPGDAWDGLSRTSRGVIEDARHVVLSCWREVVVHHGDLGLGQVALPPVLVRDWLPVELDRLVGRCDPAELLSWIIGRGPAPRLDAW